MARRTEHKEPENEVARKLNEVCVRLDLTRPELAEALGVSIPGLHKWLAGVREPNAAFLARIDAALKSLEQGHPPEAVRRFCLSGPADLDAVAEYLGKH